MCEFKESSSKTFFHQLTQQFVNKGLGNTWELAIQIIHETMRMILCKSKQVNLGVTKIEEQSVKTTN
jgi:hypothetical protein